MKVVGGLKLKGKLARGRIKGLTMKRLVLMVHTGTAGTDGTYNDGWRTVRQRKEKGRGRDITYPPRRMGTAEGAGRRRFAARPEAVFVKTQPGKSYADLFRQVASGAPEELRSDVRGVRKTRAGHLIIEVKGGGDIAKLHAAVGRAVGSDAGVRTLRPMLTIELRDLDPIVEKEKVMADLSAKYEIPVEHMIFKTISDSYAGARVAFLELLASPW